LIQEKADHRLKERLEETVFWSEEVESEIVAWTEEQFKLSEVIPLAEPPPICHPVQLTLHLNLI
jgi:hypothetical protein